MGYAEGSVRGGVFDVLSDSGKRETPEDLFVKMETWLTQFMARKLVNKDPAFNGERWGWCGPRHIYDDDFTFGNCVFAEHLHLRLRVDSYDAPGSVRQAMIKAKQEGVVGKKSKREAAEKAKDEIYQMERSGRFMRSSSSEILWDVERGLLWAEGISKKNLERLQGMFEHLGLILASRTPSRLAVEQLGLTPTEIDERIRQPSNFGPKRDLFNCPLYRWVTQAPDYLGNEFLVWLLYRSDLQGYVETAAGRITVEPCDGVATEDTDGQTGTDTYNGVGDLLHLAQLRQSLAEGKVPRRMKLKVAGGFPFTLRGENLAFGGLRLPEFEDADSKREVFERRIAWLREWRESIESLFGAFLQLRVLGNWADELREIRAWLGETGRQSEAMPAPEHRDQAVADREAQPFVGTLVDQIGEGIEKMNKPGVTLVIGGQEVEFAPPTKPPETEAERAQREEAGRQRIRAMSEAEAVEWYESRGLHDIGLTHITIEKLHRASIRTVGNLCAWLSKGPSRPKIEGVGQGLIEQITARLDAFWTTHRNAGAGPSPGAVVMKPKKAEAEQDEKADAELPCGVPTVIETVFSVKPRSRGWGQVGQTHEGWRWSAAWKIGTGKAATEKVYEWSQAFEDREACIRAMLDRVEKDVIDGTETSDGWGDHATKLFAAMDTAKKALSETAGV